MATVLALLLFTVAPSPTNWMRLEAFHLTIGMPRGQALSAVRAWNPKMGKNADEMVVDYASDKSLTLEFRNDRLKSVRFEHFVFLAHVRKAFAEQRAYLRRTLGEPRKATSSILIYDRALPNVIAVVHDNARSEQGKKGLGVIAVRYYDPR